MVLYINFIITVAKEKESDIFYLYFILVFINSILLTLNWKNKSFLFSLNPYIILFKNLFKNILITLFIDTNIKGISLFIKVLKYIVIANCKTILKV